MIRSGTTLLDQILSRHQAIKSAGECEYWTSRGVSTTIALMDGSLPKGRLRQLGEEYVQNLRRAGGDAPKIVDKMPPNFEHLGLIHCALPNAKILLIRRNPLDTALSIYMTHFGLGPPYAYNKGNIVSHYRHYLNTMEHWRASLPTGTMFELDYEDLVLNSEPVVRNVLEFLGLDWDSSCLEQGSGDSAIQTPSRWQARQPIYKSSVERWKRYEPWLGELLSLRNASGS